MDPVGRILNVPKGQLSYKLQQEQNLYNYSMRLNQIVAKAKSYNQGIEDINKYEISVNLPNDSGLTNNARNLLFHKFRVLNHKSIIRHGIKHKVLRKARSKW